MTSVTLLSRPFGSKLRIPRIALTGETAAVALGALALFGSIVVAGDNFAVPTAKAQLPVPTSMAVRPLAPNQAVAMNAAIPITATVTGAADPFRFSGNAASREQAITCLASAIYYEAGREGTDGERAVAQVVLNRVRHPAFPSSICGVVFQGSTRETGCQFTFTCDGSMARRPEAAGWRRAKELAAAAIAGSVYAPVGWATHYHANYVVPYWSASLAKNAVVGAHLFYQWHGDWGRGAAFSQNYAGREASAEGLRSAALAAEAATIGIVTSTDEAVAEIPGAEPLKLEPSMRGDKRVAIRFNMAARKAADEAPRQEYTAKVQASDNLRWVLSEETSGAGQAAFGKAQPSSTGTAATAPGPATGQSN